jgi:hypothetical protein
VVVVAQIAVDILQRRFLPDERVTVLLPKASFPWPLSAGDVLKFFAGYDLLPLAMVLLTLVIGVVGVRAVFQRRA